MIDPRLDQLTRDLATAAAAQADLTRRLAEAVAEREDLSQQLIRCVAEREDALERYAVLRPLACQSILGFRVPRVVSHLFRLLRGFRVPRVVSRLFRLLRKAYRAVGALLGRNKKLDDPAPAAEKNPPESVTLMREVEEALVTIALHSRPRS